MPEFAKTAAASPTSQQSASEFELIKNRMTERLAGLARVCSTEIRLAFLFGQDRLCGIRLETGSFRASWNSGDVNFAIFRGSQLIDSVTIAPSQRIAA